MAELEKAAFGMGCFWGPEALFGAIDGVVRTRVGYTGGSKKDPSYQDLSDHTETVLVEYDPGRVDYRELLEIFWNNHDYTREKKPQYASKIFYLDGKQKQLAEETKQEHENAKTEVQELEEFYVAENYHQKYRLRHSHLMKNFESMSPEEFRDSPLAAKANAFAAGYMSEEDYTMYKQELARH